MERFAQKNLVRAFCLALLCLCASPLGAVIRFDSLDLNSRNMLLFSATANTPWIPEYQALFTADVDGNNVRILSCFPESMELLEEGRTLQIRNWFGTARFSAENTAIKWTSQTPVFEQGRPLAYNPPSAMSVSPDGNWTAVLRKTGAATAELLLIDERNSVQTVIASDLPFDMKVVPVKWAYDSSFLVYERAGKILFGEPAMFFEKTRLSERYRTLGTGTVANVYWVPNGELVIAQGRDLFSVPKNELYTRSLYTSVIGSGRRIGQLPAEFDNKRDSFCLNNTGTAVLYVQNHANLWMYELSASAGGKNAFVAPFVCLPAQVTDVQVFWTNDNLPIIWAEQLLDGKKNTIAFRMNRTAQSGWTNYNVSALALPLGAASPVQSPDKSKIAFNSAEGLFVYDAAGWRAVSVYKEEKVNTFLWANDEALFVGGFETIRSWNIRTEVQHVLFLSSARKFGWSAGGQNVLAEAGGRILVFNQSTGLWRISDERISKRASVQNENVRVFLDSSRNGYYENAIYVRSIGSEIYTKPLFNEPSASETGAYIVQKPKVALCFEALDNADGLTEILSTLADNSVNATFFINGEFIRRYPSGVQEIVACGHQCGSLFFTTLDLSSPEYDITEEFIMQGLARNEDDFFDLTGSDLSLLWHTPQYITNSIITNAGKKAGYDFVMPDIAPADWVTLDKASKMPGMYKTSAELVEWIAEQLKPNAVITLQVGISGGGRTDYVYEYLDSLINEILIRGYEIVPYSKVAFAK